MTLVRGSVRMQGSVSLQLRAAMVKVKSRVSIHTVGQGRQPGSEIHWK